MTDVCRARAFGGLVFGVFAAVAVGAGCSHVSTEYRYRSKAQVIHLDRCRTLAVLKHFEMGLFQAGFVRIAGDGEPAPFELLESHVKGQPRLTLYNKPDFERVPIRDSEPYREIPNRYRVAGCEEPGGGLYLVVVRHDPDPADKFIGARFAEALDAASRANDCGWKPVAEPKDLAFFHDSTEDDLLRYVRRGRCRDYAFSK